jgi:NADH-quinone oxidoreductase subunit M
MIEQHLLSIITWLPAIGALIILGTSGSQETVARNARAIAMLFTLADLVVAIVIWVKFDGTSSAFQFVENAAWLDKGITYHLGVDGISMLFLVLTAGLMPICILASWKPVQNRVPEYMIAFLLLETMMMGVFVSLNLVLFYIFFEGGLIPMFLIIGVWGGKRRFYASYKFFLYTLLGSVLMLLAILWMEDGWLRFPAFLAAHVSGGHRAIRITDLRAFRHRDRLHVAGGACAGGHEEAHRLVRCSSVWASSMTAYIRATSTRMVGS